MKTKFLIVITYSSILLSACATLVNPEASVISRANSRISHVIAGEYLDAYEYLSPGYRSSVSKGAYIADMVSRRITWTSGELIGSECTENICLLRIKIDYKVISPVPGVKTFERFDHIEEDWVNSGKQWWYVPRK
jgi:hypothetical protein